MLFSHLLISPLHQLLARCSFSRRRIRIFTYTQATALILIHGGRVGEYFTPNQVKMSVCKLLYFACRFASGCSEPAGAAKTCRLAFAAKLSEKTRKRCRLRMRNRVGQTKHFDAKV
jgi:hypothetical protein